MVIEDFYAYIGPSIRGVIQRNTLYTGTRAESEESLSAQIAKYPRIKALIVGGSTLATDRANIKTPGNYLYDQNRRFIAELKKTEGGNHNG